MIEREYSARNVRAKKTEKCPLQVPRLPIGARVVDSDRGRLKVVDDQGNVSDKLFFILLYIVGFTFAQSDCSSYYSN